jgi:uncharacterized membrane protein YbhN (UPF0104 family)
MRLRKWAPALKGLLALVILGLIGRRFTLDLKHNPELWQLHLHPGWLAASGALYIFGLGFCNAYWLRLLRDLGQRPRLPAAVRAYYVGLMGKYLPGKAWALILRAGLAAGPGVHGGIAALTSFYEVLTTMAVGAFWAGVLFGLFGPATTSRLDWSAFAELLRLEIPENTSLDRNVLVLLSAALCAVIGFTIVPVVFNRVAHRISLPFRDADAAGLPQIRLRVLLAGFVLTTVNWFCFGLSLWAILHAVMDRPPPLTWENLGLFTAYMGLAYVAGFVIVVVPSGLGIREFFLTLFLVPEISRPLGLPWDDARALAFLAVVLLRLVWTAAEVIVVGVVYWLPGQKDGSQAYRMSTAELGADRTPASHSPR